MTKNINVTKLTVATHLRIALVSSLSPPVIIGGHNNDGTTAVSDNKSWMNIRSVSVHDNTIIVIGGCAKGKHI